MAQPIEITSVLPGTKKVPRTQAEQKAAAAGEDTPTKKAPVTQKADDK